MSERRIVVVLFILVFVAFSFAHEDSKKLEDLYSRFNTAPAAKLTTSNSLPENVVKKYSDPAVFNKETVSP